MEKYEHDSQKYLLPVKLRIGKRTSIPIAMVIFWFLFSPFVFINMENLTLPIISIVLVAGIIVIIAIHILFVPSYLIIDEEKIQLRSILFYKKIAYFADIQDLNVWVKDILSKYNKPTGEKKVILSYFKPNGEKDEISFSVGLKAKFNLEKMSQTIWYAYSRYHPEYSQGLE